MLVALTITGDGASGYRLLMSPEGFFTTDTWHETLEEDQHTAEDVFGVPRGHWTERR